MSKLKTVGECLDRAQEIYHAGPANEEEKTCLAMLMAIDTRQQQIDAFRKLLGEYRRPKESWAACGARLQAQLQALTLVKVQLEEIHRKMTEDVKRHKDMLQTIKKVGNDES